MNHLAFYFNEDGKEPTMRDYMEELKVFVKEPIEMVHELFVTFWERGQLSEDPKVEAAMGTLWSSLLKWDDLDEFFEDEYRKAHGIKKPCFPKTSEEERMLQDIRIKALLMPDHMKQSLMLSLFSLEDQKIFHRFLDAYVKKMEDDQNTKENSEEAIEHAEAEMAA